MNDLGEKVNERVEGEFKEVLYFNRETLKYSIVLYFPHYKDGKMRARVFKEVEII